MSGSPREVLRSNPDLQGLGESTLERILERATPVALSEGQVLFEEGENGDSAYLLLTAAVELSTRSRPRVVLAQAGPGDWVGDMALVDPGRRSATATVTRAGEALVLEADDLDDLLWDEEGELLRVLETLLERRLEHTLSDIEALLGQADARQLSLAPAEREVWALVHGSTR